MRRRRRDHLSTTGQPVHPGRFDHVRQLFIDDVMHRTGVGTLLILLLSSFTPAPFPALQMMCPSAPVDDLASTSASRVAVFGNVAYTCDPGNVLPNNEEGGFSTATVNNISCYLITNQRAAYTVRSPQCVSGHQPDWHPQNTPISPIALGQLYRSFCSQNPSLPTPTLLDHRVYTGCPLHEHRRRVPRLHRHLQLRPRILRAERLQRFGRPGMQAMLAVLFPGRDQRLSPVPAVLTRLCRRSVDRGQLQPSRTRRRSTVVRIVRSGHVRCW